MNDGEVARELRELVQHLGRHLLAVTLHVSIAVVDDWAAGTALPEGETIERMRAVHSVWRELVKVDSPAVVRAWWMGMKDQLDGLSPAEAVAAGDIRAVRSVAYDFIHGG